MAEHLPPIYLELVCDAALKSYWRHQALWFFLRRCGVKEQFLASWVKPETKRQFLNRLFPQLEMSPAGIRLINRMADFLAQQTTFPDLEGWEDGEIKKETARKAVAALSNFMVNQRRQAESNRDAKAAQARAMSIQEETRKREMDLQKLTQKLAELSRRLGTQQAGYDFQDWFYELLAFFEIVCRRPYVVDGRQIDGSVTVDGTTYLVELKFTKEQAGATDVDTFHRKVASKADNTMGILISISGFSTTALKEASGPKTPLLLFDHSHIYALLGGSMIFEEIVGRVRRHCSQTGEAYLSIQDFGG